MLLKYGGKMRINSFVRVLDPLIIDISDLNKLEMKSIDKISDDLHKVLEFEHPDLIDGVLEAYYNIKEERDKYLVELGSYLESRDEWKSRALELVKFSEDIFYNDPMYKIDKFFLFNEIYTSVKFRYYEWIIWQIDQILSPISHMFDIVIEDFDVLIYTDSSRIWINGILCLTKK
jgi:hypothetical protein